MFNIWRRVTSALCELLPFSPRTTHLSPKVTGSADAHDQDISTSIELLQSMQRVRMEVLSTRGVSGSVSEGMTEKQPYVPSPPLLQNGGRQIHSYRPSLRTKTSVEIERVNELIEETPVRISGTRKDEKRDTHADMEVDVKWEEGMNKLEQGNACAKGQTESKLKIPRLNLANCKAVSLT